jgi:hypothetical protein
MTVRTSAGLSKIVCLLACLTVVGGSSAARGEVVDWTQWTSNTSTTATGFIAELGINVSFTGEITGYTQTGGGGANYWTPTSTYTSSQVSTVPTTNGVIMLIGTAPVYTISFSQPIIDPAMDIATLGSLSQTAAWQFNAPFTLVSSGPGLLTGPSGGGTIEQYPNNLLEGAEGDGTIQFLGTYSSITWTVPLPEYFSGFTVGAARLAPVPEPGTFILSSIAGGFVARGVLRRRRQAFFGAPA